MSNKFTALIAKILKDGVPSAEYARRFQTNIAKYYLILLILTSALFIVIFPIAKLVATLCLVPMIAVIAARLLVWGSIHTNGFDDSKVEKFRNTTYFVTYPISLYVGLSGVFLLSQTTSDYVPHILLWQLCIAIVMGIMGGVEAKKYLIRIIIIFAPISIMLINTQAPPQQSLIIFITIICLIYFLVKNTITTLLRDADINEQHNKMLKDRSEKRLSGFLDTSSDWAWECNEDIEITYISENFQRVTGHPPDDYLCLFYQPKEHVAHNFKMNDITTISQATRNREKFDNIEVKFTTPDGQLKYFSLKGVPEFNKRGSFTGYRGWAFDVTHIIKNREKLKKYNSILEEKVNHRTRQLEKRAAALELTTKAAKSANHAKTEFIRNMSHEFRTPINIISGYSDTLRMSDTTNKKEVDEAASHISNASRGLLRIVNNILFLASFEDSEQSHDNDTLSIDDIIRASLQGLQTEIAREGIKISWASLSGITIYGDYSHLRKAIDEVLLNAIIYSPNKANMEIEVYRNDKGVSIDIIDEASIIPLSMTRNIQQVFKTGNQDIRTKNKEGAGLGLSIAARLIHKHGGHISFSQRENGGNITSIHLPKVRLIQAHSI